jgi:hypothetical protein
LSFLSEKKQAVAKVVQAIDKPTRRPTGMRALPDMLQILLNPHSHALVKNETLPQPVRVPVFLLIVYNPTVQLKNLLKSPMPK